MTYNLCIYRKTLLTRVDGTILVRQLAIFVEQFFQKTITVRPQTTSKGLAQSVSALAQDAAPRDRANVIVGRGVGEMPSGTIDLHSRIHLRHGLSVSVTLTNYF